MRKTSYDADSSSITSGKDSDTKKSTTTFNKMKKSSIKKKVQNFSHESDDGIIEPLLQTDKDKTEIANRSAKYLLNKSKTESIPEKDNKVTEGYADKCSVSTPVSSISNIIINNVKEAPVSTSYICGSAPIHNHMNTNIFSAFEVSTGSVTTKNQILVEIDNSKPGTYSPSPLIFTTAKIHTDSKTKVMEPVQVTPVPILSTTEVTIKAGAVNYPETTRSLAKTSESIKIVSGKPETNVLHTYKDKPLTPTIAKSPTTTSSVQASSNLLCKDIKPGQMPNSVNLPAVTKLTGTENKSLKQQPILDVLPSINTNIQISDKTKLLEKTKCATSSKNTLGKQTSHDKLKESHRILDNIDNKISLDPLKLQNQEDTHKINLESLEYRKTPSVLKDSDVTLSTGNKNLQSQQNASNGAINDPVNKIIKTDARNLIKVEDNISAKTGNLSKLENKTDVVRITLPVATKASSIITSSTAHLPKTITTSSKTEVKTTPTTLTAPKLKDKSPTLTSANKDVPKTQIISLTTSQSEIRNSKDLSTAPSKLSSVTPLPNSKVAETSVSGKPDIVSTFSSSSQVIKTEIPKPSSKSVATTSESEIKGSKDSSTTSSKLSSVTPLISSKVTATSVSGKPDNVSTSSSLSQAIRSEVSKPPSKSVAIISQSEIKDSKDTFTKSSKFSSANPLSNSKVTATSVSGKPDHVSTSSGYSQSVKTDPSIKSTLTTVNTTLPSYIVSTSKTKIGSTLTSTTPAVTSKVQTQKSSVNINTASTFATPISKPSTSTSAANGTKHTNFSKQTKSKTETLKKDGKA